MPRHLPLILAAMLVFSAVHNAGCGQENPAARAREILRKVDDLWRSTSSHAVLSMRVKTRHYTRTMRMESWSRGRDETLVRILAPLKEKGTATLKSGNSIFTYLPKVDRTIRLTSGMMMSSWMGSHFTNDDLVKESRLNEDYDPVITFEGAREGQKVVEISLTPKPEAPVVWGKIQVTGRASDYLPLKSLYYDEDMILARTLIFSRIKSMGGRDIPVVLRMRPADKPGEFTELVYDDIAFDLPLNDSLFSLKELRRR